MSITNEAAWQKWQDNNQDLYGGACVKVAKKAMELLDDPKYLFDDPWKLINDADTLSGAGGITGFMAGAAASMISECHTRGDEFRRKWNKETQIGTEGDKANESGGILNPALLTIGQSQP